MAGSPDNEGCREYTWSKTRRASAYLLAALRSLIIGGWPSRAILEGVAVLVGIGVISMSSALLVLRSRLDQGG